MHVAEIHVGFDPFHAQAIADTCRAEGIHVETVLFDHTRYELGLAGQIENRLVVRAEDELAARRIVADLFPDLVMDHPTLSAMTEPRGRGAHTKVVALVLALLFIAPLVASAIAFAIRL